MKEKIKKISKYTLNILTIVHALLIEISPIWELNCDKIIPNNTPKKASQILTIVNSKEYKVRSSSLRV